MTVDCSQGSPLPSRIGFRDPSPGEIGWLIMRHAQTYVTEFGYQPAFEQYVLQAVSAFLRNFEEGRDRLLIADLQAIPVGSVAIHKAGSETAQLRFLLTEPTVRGQGLGRRLVELCVAHARMLRVSTLRLETASNLTVARRIYASLGFQCVSRRRADWLPDAIILEDWALDLEGS